MSPPSLTVVLLRGNFGDEPRTTRTNFGTIRTEKVRYSGEGILPSWPPFSVSSTGAMHAEDSTTGSKSPMTLHCINTVARANAYLPRWTGHLDALRLRPASPVSLLPPQAQRVSHENDGVVVLAAAGSKRG